MKERIISASVLILILILVLLLGGFWFTALTCILAVGALYELMNLKLKDQSIIIKLLGYVAMLLAFYSIIRNDGSLILGLSYRVIVLNFLMLLLPTLFSKRKKYKTQDAFLLFGISMFIGVAFSLIASVNMESTKLLVFLVMISALTDTFALIGGKLIGKHKFTSISPNKTIEGCITGSLFATIICTTYYVTFISNSNIVGTIGLVLCLSIVNQLGDLFFSLIKRENDVKDYSKLIPGHGGICDRFDSIIFVTLTYIFIVSFF